MRKFVLALVLTLFPLIAMGAENVVYIFNWSEYIPDTVIAKFQKETGIKVVYSTYDSNEAMYAKVKMLKGDTYDIVAPSTFYVERMSKEGMLQPLDKSKLSNFKNLDPNLLDKPSDPGNKYSMPYLWGSTAICVNSEKINPADITSWNDLWKPEFKGNLLLIDDIREVFGLGLKVLGYSINDQDPDHIKQAYEKLKTLMPNIRVFSAETLTQPFLNQEVTIGMNWNGEVYRASQESNKIKYIYPKEGPMIWMDSMAILKDAKNIENAHKFMNFTMRPDIAKIISEEIGYATPNKAALESMDKKIRTNKTIYPDSQTIQKGEFFMEVGNAIVIYEKYWEKLKASN